MSIEDASRLLLDAVAQDDPLEGARLLAASMDATMRAASAGEHPGKVCFVQLHCAQMLTRNIVPRICLLASEMTEPERWYVFGSISTAVRHAYEWFAMEVEAGAIIENAETALPERSELTRRLRLAMGARVA